MSTEMKDHRALFGWRGVETELERADPAGHFPLRRGKISALGWG